MADYQNLLAVSRQKLLKAIRHLEYSYNKIKTLPNNVSTLDDETLETWESFSARFARVAEIFLTRYLRSYVLAADPGFEGTLRDFVNQGEKLGLIDDARVWMGIRELRNISSHDYSETDLTHFFIRLKNEAPRLLSIREKLDAPDSQ
ncbi:MAG: nucleotidyltransferase substrate binding protein [Proteobacteria bacterium]|nr:nucleotidyltransferase substrate binding protein [Pseudomonadota bacterium]